MDGTSPHAVLGVPENATDDEIRRAYRAAARALHPDMGGDASKFAAATGAYRSLRRRWPRRPNPFLVAPADAAPTWVAYDSARARPRPVSFASVLQAHLDLKPALV